MNKSSASLYAFEGQQDLASPQLVYYPALIRQNIQKMIAIAGGADRLWPHIKTHKMAQVVQMQLEAGIDRFKCATIAEAEMAAQAGAKRITLAYPLVGPTSGGLPLCSRPSPRWSSLPLGMTPSRSVCWARPARPTC